MLVERSLEGFFLTKSSNLGFDKITEKPVDLHVRVGWLLRGKQVYIGWLEAAVLLSTYLRKR
jgi:hypothetical protein